MTMVELFYVLATTNSLTVAFNLGAACVAIALLGQFNGRVLTVRRTSLLALFGAGLILWSLFGNHLI